MHADFIHALICFRQSVDFFLTLYAARNVISEKIYNISGTQIAVPANNAKNVYIVVKNYDDGTREIMREIR